MYASKITHVMSYFYSLYMLLHKLLPTSTHKYISIIINDYKFIMIKEKTQSWMREMGNTLVLWYGSTL